MRVDTLLRRSAGLDVAQMMTHKYALPLAPGSRWKNQIPDGRLVYRNGTELARLNDLDCPERVGRGAPSVGEPHKEHSSAQINTDRMSVSRTGGLCPAINAPAWRI